MAVKADTVLENIRKDEEEKLKSILVEKDIDLQFDIGNLLASDTNLHDDKSVRSKKSTRETYLRNLARDNTQLLYNEIWKLPIERVEDTVIAKLPPPETLLPREKPIPKPKPLTKWQAYAKLKGIQNKKKSRMVWDEKTQSWRPRWGYKRANDPTKEWFLEVPQNADPYEDQFEKKLNEKKDRTAKNELQRLRNIARRTGKKVPGVGNTPFPGDIQDVTELKTSFHLAKHSTASLGRFEETLRHEKPEKKRGSKRKFDPVINPNEKERHLAILNSMYKKTSKIDVAKATNRELRQTEVSNVTPRNKRGKSFSKKKGGKK